VPLSVEGAGSPSNTTSPGLTPTSYRWHSDPSILLATLDMDLGLHGRSVRKPRKCVWGGVLCPFLWGRRELGPRLTQRGLAEAYLRNNWHFDPSNCLATIRQCYRQTGKTGQGRQDNGRIAQGEPFYKRSGPPYAIGPLSVCLCRPHCVRWGPSSPMERDTAAPTSIVVKRLDRSGYHLVRRSASTQATLC